MSTLLTLAAFWGLVGYTVSDRARRAQVLGRGAKEWVLDVSGLLVQGVLIPLVLTVPLLSLYGALFPALQGAVRVPAFLSFMLAFVAVDYVYYWNHRLLHTRALWPLHKVHHSAAQMDVLVSSRNTLWTSLLIVYVWATSAALFLLAEPGPYLWGAGLTAALDLARHSPVELARWPRVARVLGALFVLPHDHARHHADAAVHGNFGANLMIWDRLHGTYVSSDSTLKLGIDNPLGLARSLWWPFEPSSEGCAAGSLQAHDSSSSMR